MTISSSNSFYTEKGLYEEVSKYWSQVARETDTKIEAPKKEIARGFEAYKAARNTFLPFIVLGEAELRTDTELLQNVGTLATDSQYNQLAMRKFLENANGVKPEKSKKLVAQHLTNGSVVNDSNWWIFRNDMFMLGAIHEGKEFHVATKKGELPSNDILWDAKANRPRALGRELLMLHFSGYQCVRGPKELGYIFTRPCGAPDLKLTLKECREKIAEVKSVEQIRALFKNPIPNPTAPSRPSLSKAPLSEQNTINAKATSSSATASPS